MSTRDVVLQSIQSMHGATVEQLAAAAEVSPVTVRHHLNSLQADGLIESESVRRKVGRPYHVYSLSEAGLELFPKKYYLLSSRLLNEVKNRFSADTVTELFGAVVNGIIDEHRSQFESLDFEARLDYLIELLAEEGFLANWHREGDTYHINEMSCPFISIGQQHAEICTLDKALIEAVMDTDVSQNSCMLNGDECCQFTVIPNQQIIELPKVTVR